MSVTIYHNPDCGTSRNALAMVRASGVEPRVVEYLADPPPRTRLAALHEAAGITAREGMRVKGNEALIDGLGLREPDPDPARDAARILEAMRAHPILIQRPLVEGPRGTVLARPSERVLEVLAEPDTGAFAKEDGEIVRPAAP